MDKYLLKEVMLFTCTNLQEESPIIVQKINLVVQFIGYLCVLAVGRSAYHWIKVLCSVRCKPSFLMPSGIYIQCKKAYFLGVKYQCICMFYGFPGPAVNKSLLILHGCTGLSKIPH